MRAKTPKAVVTFATTSDAMAMEAAARTHGIPGRLIPVPSEIDAGCGLSWSAEASEREELLAAIAQHNIAHQGIYEVSMY
ncbi:Protein of uncharacterised function (DUF3343) [Slackia heliotrinireducens]|uniref:Putative Se/S carrier protein-like domain-containing protein n=1 Tax=Slackia heliotrinireducens (strain ATCC 29202 / DSM 20476 / NCTC 11029 / RHS 1) TaxID=471855 RepID=C7N2P2_SLAHD|nr:DUF3343 domain-containing protein [Slackia heliotrinireducens]ACV23550.1 hypothetical protein Shel_25430 [Slackia heliotrinireducens DSM 20476]VEH02970.1 Protein of uncharacterised function (DUF3343) [Slackia heliotrinireducens]